jgi:hypothetical protein
MIESKKIAIREECDWGPALIIMIVAEINESMIFERVLFAEA